jgi:hypothetical protein
MGCSFYRNFPVACGSLLDVSSRERNVDFLLLFLALIDNVAEFSISLGKQLLP